MAEKLLKISMTADALTEMKLALSKQNTLVLNRCKIDGKTEPVMAASNDRYRVNANRC